MLAEAQRAFEALATDGNASADRMASLCLTESADVLRAAGQLDESAARYEQAMARDEARGNRRDVAVNTTQLGTVRLLQRDFAAALAQFHQAKEFFEGAGSPLWSRPCGTSSAMCTKMLATATPRSPPTCSRCV